MAASYSVPHFCVLALLAGDAEFLVLHGLLAGLDRVRDGGLLLAYHVLAVPVRLEHLLLRVLGNGNDLILRLVGQVLYLLPGLASRLRRGEERNSGAHY